MLNITVMRIYFVVYIFFSCMQPLISFIPANLYFLLVHFKKCIHKFAAAKVQWRKN